MAKAEKLASFKSKQKRSKIELQKGMTFSDELNSLGYSTLNPQAMETLSMMTRGQRLRALLMICLEINRRRRKKKANLC